jgi:hypothetical protein
MRRENCQIGEVERFSSCSLASSSRCRSRSTLRNSRMGKRRGDESSEIGIASFVTSVTDGVRSLPASSGFGIERERSRATTALLQTDCVVRHDGAGRRCARLRERSRSRSSEGLRLPSRHCDDAVNRSGDALGAALPMRRRSRAVRARCSARARVPAAGLRQRTIRAVHWQADGKSGAANAGWRERHAHRCRWQESCEPLGCQSVHGECG